MFERLENFRDFGGYPTRHGRALVRGRLYRSAHHADLTDADLERLQTLDIAVFVDLRRADERRRQPCRRPPGFAGTVIENDLGDMTEDAWLGFIRDTPDITAETFTRDALGFYRSGPYEERHIDLFARYFEALARADGAILIHCAAGKDRTGILAALTHHMAGVPDEHILHDYLLTNDPAAIARRVQNVARYVEQRIGKRLTDEVLTVALGVQEAYLRTAFDEMAERSGSVDGYLEDVLKIGADQRRTIVERLLSR